MSMQNQFFGIDVIDFRALRLAVRTVIAVVYHIAFCINGGTFIEVYAVMCQGSDELGCGVCHFAFGICVFNSQINYSAVAVCQSLIDQCLIHAAKMDKACGTGGKTGDFLLGGKCTGRILLFQFCGGTIHMGEKQISQLLIVVHRHFSPAVQIYIKRNIVRDLINVDMGL